MLTVEEAGALLRIGRTKAYAMAREWRETNGRSGLPVIDFGHVLRVPRSALEEMIGADLSTIDGGDTRSPGTSVVADRSHREGTDAVAAPTTRRPRRHNKDNTDQLDLFHPAVTND